MITWTLEVTQQLIPTQSPHLQQDHGRRHGNQQHCLGLGVNLTSGGNTGLSDWRVLSSGASSDPNMATGSSQEPKKLGLLVAFGGNTGHGNQHKTPATVGPHI